MTINLSLFNEQELERLHGKCLDVLEKIGLQFNSQQALGMLGDAGCDVDLEEGSAKIPPAVVERALETVPRQIALAARNPERDVHYGSGELNFISAAQGPFFRDLDTRERRASTSADLIQCALLCDALDEVTEFAPMVVPHDVPPILRGLQAAKIAYTYSSMHVVGGMADLTTQPYQLEIIDALLGDRKRLKERPLFSHVINDVSPLQKDADMVDATLALADYTPPILLYYMPLAGGTAPVTLAGSVLEMTANMLGSVVLYQLAHPGWPIIWGTGPGVLDMRTGRFSGRAELALMSVAHVEMARYYGLPALSGDLSSPDAKSIGFQSGMDAVIGSLPVVLAGTDALWGPGDLDAATFVDLPFLLLCTEVVRQLKRLKEGIRLDEEHFLFDAIAEMRFHGEYLGHPSTKKHFREEHLLPKLFPRESYEAWEARAQSEEDMAIARVKEILANHEPDPLPEDVETEIDRIIEAAEVHLVE